MVARILTVLVLVAVGAVAAAVATVAHQNTVAVLGADVPWGLIVSLVSVACLLAGVRLVTEGRLDAVAAAVGVLGMIGLLSLKSVGGSVLIPDNMIGQVWVFGPVIIAAVVVAWPRPAHRRGGAAPTASGVN